MTASEMGRKGGKKRWRKISKQQRYEQMRRVARLRWRKTQPATKNP